MGDIRPVEVVPMSKASITPTIPRPDDHVRRRFLATASQGSNDVQTTPLPTPVCERHQVDDVVHNFASGVAGGIPEPSRPILQKRWGRTSKCNEGV